MESSHEIGRRLLRAAVVLLLAGSVLGGSCDPKTANYFGLIDANGGVQTGTLTGTVSSGGTGIGGATVALTGTAGRTTTTLSNGAYTFTGLQVGPYAGMTTATGFNCPGFDVTIQAGQTTTRNVNCTSTAPTTGNLTVTVTGLPSGTNASVQITHAGGSRTGTTSGGIVQFTGLDTGAYTITATVTGFSCTGTTANVTAGQTATASVPCSQQQTTGTLNVTVVQTGTTIPISGANVTATGPGGATLTGTTNASGQVTLANAAAGSWSVAATVTGRTCASQSATVTAGQTANVTVPCASTGAEFSVVLNNPPPSYRHPAGSMTSETCTGIGTSPAQPGASYMVMWTGPGIVGSGTRSGTLDSSGSTIDRQTISQIGTYNVNVSVTSSGTTRMASGSVNVTGAAGTCPTPSSARFKRDIVALAPEGVTILGLRPVAFRYLPAWGDPAAPQVGLIAEEVVRVYPQAILLDGGGAPAAIDYGALTGLVLEAIQTRAAQELESRLARLAEALAD